METTELLKKFFFKQWVIGLSRGDVKDIIRTRTFSQDIKWLPVDSRTHFYADPFLVKSGNGKIDILFEDFSIEDNYGNISLLTLDEDMNETERKILLDTKSHLSFPFVFTENNRTFVFPESSRKGNLSCYEFDPVKQSLEFVKVIADLPLYDSAILKMNGRYWLFGTLFENRADYKLYIFYSDNLLGPYVPLPGNPVKNGLDGNRAAGNFIEVDGRIYRPTQNCNNKYGESITINRITRLDEASFSEEPYMNITINNRNRQQENIHTIHTLNFYNDLIVVDGMKWTFSLKEQWRNFRRNRRLLQQTELIRKSASAGKIQSQSSQ